MERLRHLFSRTLLILTALLCCTALCVPPSMSASTKEEYNKVQRDLRQKKKKLEQAKRAERSVLSDLRRLNSELVELDEQTGKKRSQIASMKQQLSGLENEIGKRAASLDEQRTYLRSRLLTLQRIAMQKEAILMILSNEDSAKALRIARYLTDISNKYSDSITGYRTEIEQLGSKKRSLESLVQGLRNEEKNLERLEASAKSKKEEKEKLLVQVRKEKGAYEQMVNELKESSDRLSRIIKQSEKPSRKKGKPQARADEDDIPVDSAFSRMKGRLAWPVSGTVAIRYGSQVDPLFNLPVFRSGIHIKAPGGASVSAVAEGTVVYADDFKGYGQLVILSHGNGYHTLYGNLAGNLPRKDAIIKERQTIGEVGDSAALGTSGLYFELRYKGKPLDPQQWLKKSGG